MYQKADIRRKSRRKNVSIFIFFKVYLLESCRTELEAEQKRHREFADHELRQRQAYAQVQRQVESLESEKRQLETRILEFKARVTNLQQELDNSVAVQNDFVRLSQSLQMELEKIRSQSTEVWKMSHSN